VRIIRYNLLCSYVEWQALPRIIVYFMTRATSLHPFPSTASSPMFFKRSSCQVPDTRYGLSLLLIMPITWSPRRDIPSLTISIVTRTDNNLGLEPRIPCKMEKQTKSSVKRKKHIKRIVQCGIPNST